MLSAGVNLVVALEAVRPLADSGLQEMANKLSHTVRSGHLFSQALAAHPESFAPGYISLIRMGEETGRLAAIMTHLGEWLERDHNLRQNLRSALAYPTLVVTVAALMMVTMVYLVLPGFLEVLRGLAHLPWFTRALIALVDFVRGPGVAVVLVTLFVVGRGLYTYLSTAEGKRSLQLSMLGTPGLGPFVQSISIARYCLSMQVASNAGMNLAGGLGLASQISDNPKIADDFPALRAHIENGGEVWAHFHERPDIYPRIFVQMVRTGEETSKGSHLYALLAQWYERESEYRSRFLLQMLEPALLMFLGFTVAGILLCVFLPIYQSLNLN